jgi:GNAT superfamily N-acetyltransferase
MPASAADAIQSIAAQVSRRWQTLDPLLPAADGMQSNPAAHVIVAEVDGEPVAAGACEHWAGTPDSLDTTWGAARRFILTVQVAGQNVGLSLDVLLSHWRRHLGGELAASQADSAAVVTWPSRDVAGITTLLSRGFAPRGVVAVRALSHHRAAIGHRRSEDDDPAGVRIRAAGPDDLATVVSLGQKVIQFDSHFGGVVERPGTGAALRNEVQGMLGGVQPWTWLAERDGAAIGMLAGQGPASAGWIAPMVRAAPVAYNMLTFVDPAERGSGVGNALAARFHLEAEAAGAAVTLLHYEQTNPLAAPFWGHQGYRPIWTSWETRPASTIR